MRLEKTGIALLGIVMSFASLATAQQSRWATPNDPTAKSMIAMERQWAELACSNNNVLEKLLADDFQGTAPDGTRYTKAEEMKSDDGRKPRARDCRLGEVKVHFFGETTALLYGSESSIRKGTDEKDFKRCLVWTDTWLKRNGLWQIVAAQDTQVPCK
jgi:Domain of unknown function (DUF4440)